MPSMKYTRYDQADVETYLRDRKHEAIAFISARSFAIKGDITLECFEHGEFHSNAGYIFGRAWICQKCWYEHMPTRFKTVPKNHAKAKTLVVFLEKLTLPDHITLDTTNFRGMTSGEIFVDCSIHGRSSYESAAALMQRKLVCKFCGKDRAHPIITSWENFLIEAQKKFSERFQYKQLDNTEWIGLKTKIEISCGKHEPKIIDAGKHINRGTYCHDCRMEDNKRAGMLPGHLESILQKDGVFAKKLGTLYYVKIGSLYKIGVTWSKGGPEKRFRDLSRKMKNPIEILGLHGATMREVFRYEQLILRLWTSERVVRSWSTELFEEDILSPFGGLLGFISLLKMTRMQWLPNNQASKSSIRRMALKIGMSKRDANAVAEPQSKWISNYEKGLQEI